MYVRALEFPRIFAKPIWKQIMTLIGTKIKKAVQKSVAREKKLYQKISSFAFLFENRVSDIAYECRPRTRRRRRRSCKL